MKRILTAILAFLYLSTSMGITIHLHYCMGKVISWGLINHESRNCAACGMEKENGIQDGVSSHKNCCRDEHKTIKAGKDQKATQTEFQFVKLSSDPSMMYVSTLLSSGISSISIQNPRANAPPPISGQSLFLLNRNFRI
jgi:hypothetical protein